MSNIKLGVEVASAHDLMPKDVQGSASPFVELHLDHQKIRTTVKEKDLNPCWNETFYFNISDHDDLTDLTLDAYVYNNAKGGNISNPNSFMGKVHINGTSFVPYSDAVVSHYPLQKLNIVSRVKGELRLKAFIVDDFSLRSSNPISQMETSSNHHLQNPTFQQQQSQFPSQQPYMAQHPQGTQYAYDDIRNRNQIQSQSQSQTEVVRTNSGSSSQHFENPINETTPVLGSGQVIGGRVVNSDNMRTSTYDLVEPMQILFVRVVKAKDLPTIDVTGRLDPYVEVRIGNYKESTQHFSKTLNPEWNTVFAFSKERMQASILDVMVKDKDMIEDDFLGIVRVNLHDIPTRFPSDIPLSPEWYRLEDQKGAKRKAELMFAVWFGTQADEAFPDAFLLDAAMSNADSSSSTSSMYTRSKVYHSPRLWYVRVNIIEIQDLVLAKKTRFPYVRVKAQINNQVSRTRPVQVRAASASWNEDMMFVAAEPFEDHLILTIEDRVGPNKDEVLGKVFIPLNSIEMRPDDRIINSRWFDLQDLGDNEIDGMKKKKEQLATRLQLRVCLDGGYHVLTESTQYSSDVRPTAKELWKPSIGILELGILNASSLQPMKTRGGKGTVDAYCVAKYGHKWLRTQTVVDSLAPQFNEQYTWEVYDPSTILTVGIFDNAQLKNGNSKDTRIGRIRIRISTLDMGRVYTHSYPLLVLHPTGVKKMGELNLAIRFSNTSLISMMNMMLMYSKPLLPKMHYLWPLTIVQFEMLRNQAIGMVADQLGIEEPPLGREIVEYMMDVNSHVWSVRRSKSIFFRLMLLFDWAFVFSKWFKQVCSWKDGITSVAAHILLVMLVSSPDTIPPVFCMYMIAFVLTNQLQLRGQYPPHMNTGLSYVDNVDPDELNEGFDSFLASRSPELVRHSYDRLRSASKQIQSFVEDIVSLAEQVNWLLTWRDPRATTIFLGVLFLAFVVLLVIPFQVLVIVSGFYVMRHPRFRHRVPSASLNFLGRLPDHTDSML